MLRDIGLGNLKPVAMQIVHNVIKAGSESCQITSHGEAEMVIAKWNERSKEHPFIANSDFADIG